MHYIKLDNHYRPFKLLAIPIALAALRAALPQTKVGIKLWPVLIRKKHGALNI